MKHIIYGQDNSLIKHAILIKSAALNEQEIRHHYVQKMQVDNIVAVELLYQNDKITAKFAKEYLIDLLNDLDSINITTLYVADSNYFKFLTGVKKVTNVYNEVVPCNIKGFEHINCILGVNYTASLYDPKLKDRLLDSIEVFNQFIHGSFTATKLEIAHADYTYNYSQLIQVLNTTVYTEADVLAIDIETSGPKAKDALRFNLATLETISFAYSTDSGAALNIEGNSKCLEALANFFRTYKGKCVYHNGLFDIKYLVYHLFMDHDNDFEGMFEGIRVLTQHIDDTMLMTYLSTNSTAGNTLGLKSNVLTFAGNYAEDVTDVKTLELYILLEYNLKDTLATFWLYEKRKKDLVTENQVDIYQNVFLPAIPALLEMMLVGLPMDPQRVLDVKQELELTQAKYLQVINDSDDVYEAQFQLAVKAMRKKNSTLKKKMVSIDDMIEDFNPFSNTQKIVLFYEVMELPILDYTATKQPSCSGGTLKKLLDHNSVSPKDKELLQAFINVMDTSKILNTFIKAFQQYEYNRGTTAWLNGNQKLGGTLSGRLASNEP